MHHELLPVKLSHLPGSWSFEVWVVGYANVPVGGISRYVHEHDLRQEPVIPVQRGGHVKVHWLPCQLDVLAQFGSNALVDACRANREPDLAVGEKFCNLLGHRGLCLQWFTFAHPKQKKRKFMYSGARFANQADVRMFPWHRYRAARSRLVMSGGMSSMATPAIIAASGNAAKRIFVLSRLAGTVALKVAACRKSA